MGHDGPTVLFVTRLLITKVLHKVYFFLLHPFNFNLPRHGTRRHLWARREPEPSVQQKVTMVEVKKEKRVPKERKKERKKENEDVFMDLCAVTNKQPCRFFISVVTINGTK